MNVSPNITDAEWASGAKDDVDVFADQLQGWLFDQARALANGQHAGPAILALVTPYFEVTQSYTTGQESKNQSNAFLKAGLRQVFPAVPDAAIDLYISEVRHGFAHEAMFRRVAIYHGAQLALDASGNLIVDPWWILETAETHFKAYVASLRAKTDPNQIHHFQQFMNIRKRR